MAENTFDADVLREQLEAARLLDLDGQRVVGEVLREYGDELIAGVERLRRFKELLADRL